MFPSFLLLHIKESAGRMTKGFVDLQQSHLLYWAGPHLLPAAPMPAFLLGGWTHSKVLGGAGKSQFFSRYSPATGKQSGVPGNQWQK